jgi:PAS domain S-box-containing protein
VLDLNKFTIIDWTPATQNIFGYDKTEIIGQNIEIFLRPEEIDVIENQLIQCVKNNTEWHEDICVVKKDKSLAYYEMSIIPHENSIGEMIAHVSVGRNITDKYLYNEKLQKEVDKRKLVENEVNLYKQALDEIDTAVLIFDNTDKDVKFINEAFKQMHGYEEEDNIQFNLVNNNPNFSISPIKNTKYCLAMKQEL